MYASFELRDQNSLEVFHIEHDKFIANSSGWEIFQKI